MSLAWYLRQHMRLALALRIVALTGLVGLAHGEGVRVVYPAYEVAGDVRFDDLIEIMRIALEKTVPEFGPFELAASPRGMNEARYLSELGSESKLVNIVWSSTSTQKEADFLPIRIPLRKGLLGYRIALIAKGSQAKLDQATSLTLLKQFTIGQGNGWGDVDIYKANGFTVRTAQYGNLFEMVDNGRFDLFPRGIGEIFPEFAQHAKDNPNLTIEKNLLIYYPWPYYFFFKKSDAALKQRIEVGLRRMMKDGSFDANFQKYNGVAIRQADLKNRRVIRITNNMLPKETPLNDASLWFDPSK